MSLGLLRVSSAKVEMAGNGSNKPVASIPNAGRYTGTDANVGLMFRNEDREIYSCRAGQESGDLITSTTLLNVHHALSHSKTRQHGRP